MANESTIRAYGGQAVLGGVMMRGATTWAVAVRRPTGEIALHQDLVPGWGKRWSGIPVVRGLVSLAESLTLGGRALDWAGRQHEAGDGGDDTAPTRSGPVDTLITIVAVVLAVGLFVAVPAVVARATPGVTGGVRLSVVEGVLRIGLLVAYVSGIGRVPEIERLYQYHGAEHKAVTALEAGAELTPASVGRFSTRHPRCGTTFLLVVMVVAVVVHAFLGRPSWPSLIASRLLLVPVVAGVSFELIRWAARHVDRPWVARALAPGLALQRLTTREPSAEQVEVALAALHAVVAADGRAEAEPVT